MPPRKYCCYRKKAYTLTELVQKTGLKRSTIWRRLNRDGWTVKDVLKNKPPMNKQKGYLFTKRHTAAAKLNPTMMRCKSCGMVFVLKASSKRRFCDRVCMKQYHKHPDIFGLWWSS